VVIATDDPRIIESAQRFGARTVITGVCENGTERLVQALEVLKEQGDPIINLQGDAVLTPPWFITALIDEMKRDPLVSYATPAVRVSEEQYQSILQSKKVNPFSGAFVTFSNTMNALYFSKQIIPALRNVEKPLPLFKHIGLYAYRDHALRKYVTLAPGFFEQVEGLEQLRILEHGDSIRVVLVDFQGRSSWAVDAPDDIAIVEEIIKREGEILPT
jgi:3-deoxy-manno-octulosonate cytidylyltransferase (CMP-KDO synthetase)